MSQGQVVRPARPWAFPSGEAANALSSSPGASGAVHVDRQRPAAELPAHAGPARAVLGPVLGGWGRVGESEPCPVRPLGREADVHPARVVAPNSHVSARREGRTHAVITPLALPWSPCRPPGASVPPTGRNQRPMRWAFVKASHSSAPAVRSLRASVTARAGSPSRPPRFLRCLGPGADGVARRTGRRGAGTRPGPAGRRRGV